MAPLGTALTEDQLALLWKMADEPVLCFDGDDAGMRAAYRAVELAMPRLKPGKSLKFALLPQGQDPDDLVRSAGREAVVEVIDAARPLAACCGRAKPKVTTFDTPERRAALEARINEVTTGIADEVVRNITGRISRTGCGNFLRRRGRNSATARGNLRGPRTATDSAIAKAPGNAATRRARRSGQHALCRGQPANGVEPAASWRAHGGAAARGADPAGRAQPSLAAARPSGGISLARVPLRRRRKAQRRVDRHRRPFGGADSAAIKAELAARDLTEVMGRIAASITTASVWGARPEAAPEDVLVTWQQLVALHRQWHSLTKELKDAEQALGQDASEANYLRLRDVKARLERMDGTEALIEGFGASSGRGARSL